MNDKEQEAKELFDDQQRKVEEELESIKKSKHGKVRQVWDLRKKIWEILKIIWKLLPL